MEGNYTIYYTPEKQYPGMPHGEMCGDFMPFYYEGVYYLFYLYKYCVFAVQTRDFVSFGEPYLVLQNGSPEDQDWHIGTGSVFHHEGIFYFHYTGFCEGNHGKTGKNEQVVLRAISRDLLTWEKDEDFYFPPDTEYYGDRHWRDPHVDWNEELQKYTMLITATTKEGAHLRSGCTAVYCSEDVRNWEHYRTVYAPRTFITHECHDCFQIGDRWYLTFSNYSRWWETRYRIAKSFNGPWTVPQQDDMFDGRQLYAAKTVTDGQKRYLVGWQSIKENCADNGRCLWGGNLLVHELVQRADKTLGVKPVEAVEQSFCRELPAEYISCQGEFRCSQDERVIEGGAEDGFGWAQAGRLKETCLFRAELEWSETTAAVGLMIHADGVQLRQWCQLRIEPAAGKIVMDRFDRVDGDQSYLDERPIRLENNHASVRLIVSGNIMQVYVNDVALTTRSYRSQTGVVGVFAEYGSVRCTDVRLLEQE